MLSLFFDILYFPAGPPPRSLMPRVRGALRACGRWHGRRRFSPFLANRLNRRRNRRIPAVRVAHVDHETQDVVPRTGLRHRRVREHAAVPADVLKRARRLAALVAHPKTGVTHDVELAVRIGRPTVTTRLVMRARSEDGRIVLRDVEVDRPRPQRVGHDPERHVERLALGPVVLLRKNPILWRVE